MSQFSRWTSRGNACYAGYRNPRNGFYPVFPSACLGSSFHSLSRFGHRRFGKIVYQGHPRVWSIVCPESFVPFPQQNFWNILKLQLLLNEGRPRNIGNYFYTSDRIYLVALFSVKPKNKGPWIASSVLPLSGVITTQIFDHSCNAERGRSAVSQKPKLTVQICSSGWDKSSLVARDLSYPSLRSERELGLVTCL